MERRKKEIDNLNVSDEEMLEKFFLVWLSKLNNKIFIHIFKSERIDEEARRGSDTEGGPEAKGHRISGAKYWEYSQNESSNARGLRNAT